ncbi:MAG TPA: hypothetical protein ENK44_10680 [Caldithrix abyssi]|uniref:ABC-type transport auxiliary lipoprotein component domain-containing protein n=1 Tax=Caldithrix abyssi TaxID=187145 RepID=A0A7V4U1K1_CALAY|nr:hypothetical protein [Caldithrix abyssi]
MRKSVVILCIVAFILSSCASERIITKFYVMDNVPEQPIDSSGTPTAALPYVVMVDNFSISRIYDSNRIALRTNSNEISYYIYHKWAENPSAALQTIVWRQLRGLHLFQTCNLRRIEPEPNYKISGHIDRIERVEQDDYDAAHVMITLQFKDYDTGEVLVQHIYNRFTSLNEKDMNHFAKALNQIIVEQNSVFFEKIRHYFERQSQ